jgi:hypothetical protein
MFVGHSRSNLHIIHYYVGKSGHTQYCHTHVILVTKPQPYVTFSTTAVTQFTHFIINLSFFVACVIIRGFFPSFSFFDHKTDIYIYIYIYKEIYKVERKRERMYILYIEKLCILYYIFCLCAFFSPFVGRHKICCTVTKIRTSPVNRVHTSKSI